MIILFQPNQVRCETKPGENILQAAERANVLIDGSCSGKGTCGTCKIRVISGLTSPRTEAENCLTADEIAAGYRLACQTIPLDDLVVELPGIHQGSGRKKKMAALPEDFVGSPCITKVNLQVTKATMQDQRSDDNRLIDTLNRKGAYVDHRLLPYINKTLKAQGGDVTAVLQKDRILALEAGDTTEANYGLAVDVGTTTVVAMLWDLNTVTNIGVSARTNPQSIYGADVISRIQYCNEDAPHLDKMQGKIIDCVNDMLVELCQSAGISADNIYDMTVDGNTTMSHLFLGIHPRPMSRTPFAPVFCRAQDRLASELKININPLANVRFLPNIAGHVGADISSVLLATNLKQLPGVHIALDIGTNGEILLAVDGEVLACSTAAGPAFEGACIYMGMRAADGAIERVDVADDDLSIRTIENAAPIGICGSGLIDAVACLLRLGLIEPSGQMISIDEARRRGIPAKIADRIVEHENHPAIRLADMENGMPILLTQQDIREVQLAKGAIYAGMETMMHMKNITDEQIGSILLAGAFGNYISKRSALDIGLLPNIDLDKIISVGNAAGVGTCMTLLSDTCRNRIDEEVAGITHVELSGSAVFQDEYMLAMGFPECGR